MRVIATRHPDVKILEPRLFEDSRGFLVETYNERVFAECIEDPPRFVQDNHSSSVQHVLRGLHYQVGGCPQAKLVRVLSGKIFDVAVDLPRGRATFGQWVGEILSADNRRQLWVPEGLCPRVPGAQRAGRLRLQAERPVPTRSRAVPAVE